MIGTFSLVRTLGNLYILFPETSEAETIRAKHQPGSSCLRVIYPDEPHIPAGALVEIDSQYLVPYSFAYLKPKNMEGIDEGNKNTGGSS